MSKYIRRAARLSAEERADAARESVSAELMALEAKAGRNAREEMRMMSLRGRAKALGLEPCAGAYVRECEDGSADIYL